MTDEELSERLLLLRESILRSAPCQPPRSQADVDFVFRELMQLRGLRPESGSGVDGLLFALRRECAVEGLLYPEAAVS